MTGAKLSLIEEKKLEDVLKSVIPGIKLQSGMTLGELGFDSMAIIAVQLELDAKGMMDLDEDADMLNLTISELAKKLK